ncbi:hypothetical protein R70006_06207 [Paraburkholderia domus]|uniref:hypothetical protein n=1 Tax=Paraburkholderia domus TaxID=2793075 RepID=UPI0019138E0A|nr:hypothetical protein [Paraburkholderia domus]MBK5052839.1 hypothetical protein [Burkholderia sp. R-70006]CAE6821222.1 hypothetical protein R70006_06207 [Paraburkholderia domus]
MLLFQNRNDVPAEYRLFEAFCLLYAAFILLGSAMGVNLVLNAEYGSFKWVSNVVVLAALPIGTLFVYFRAARADRHPVFALGALAAWALGCIGGGFYYFGVMWYQSVFGQAF